MFFILNPIGYTIGLLIGFVLRPVIWLVRQLLRLSVLILKGLLSLLLQALLFGAIFIIGFSKRLYSWMVQRFPVVNDALPSVVLAFILLTMTTIIMTH